MKFRLNEPLLEQNCSAKGAASLISKLFLTLFFSIFAAGGIFFMVVMIREISRGESSRNLIWFLWFPLIFILIGLGGIFGTWFFKRKGGPDMPKGSRSTTGSGRNIGLLVGGVFILVGLGLFYGIGLRPFMKNRQAQRWIETPCKIISASVGSHSDDDGTTYSIDITYEYEFNGQVYSCDRYDFLDFSSSGYEGKERVVNRYLNMKSPVCYVDPDNPAEAVLERTLTGRYAVGLIPLIFAGVGGLAIGAVLKQPRRGKGVAAWLPVMKRDKDTIDSISAENPYAFSRDGVQGDMADASITLAPSHSPWGKLIGIIVFCLIWNGIVSVFVWQMIEGFRSGRPEWFLVVFLIPFELVGLGCIVGVFYQFLALFNPRYTMTLRPGRLYPGAVGQITWASSGRSDRVSELTITLVGEERATYRVGTDTKTATALFYEMELMKTQDRYEIASGEIGFGIPTDTMHSFEASNNKIVWMIKLRGDIEKWPDVKQEYQITVYPINTSKEGTR